MSEVSKEKFLQAYGNLLAQSWGNPDLLKRFKAAPGKVLAEYGLDPEGAAIEVIKPGAGWNAEGSPDAQVKMWNDGKKAGKIRLYFPEEAPPDLKTAELSDQELEAVAGGGSACCCSPCSCC
ncbi:MAG: hypothetical protein EDX89_00680 [Acidobacteria bacterium]|nr:MAG: hypothetical protein EDX89_00680 [Acidobacteriota bacterium]MCE7956370.1 hypothetical protein [Acidobacteria bacterium ACB2]